MAREHKGRTEGTSKEVQNTKHPHSELKTNSAPQKRGPNFDTNLKELKFTKLDDKVIIKLRSMTEARSQFQGLLREAICTLVVLSINMLHVYSEKEWNHMPNGNTPVV